MLRIVDHGDVREIVMSSVASRLTGFKVSAYVHRGTLIDTGFPRAKGELDRWIRSNPVRGAIVTHWHEDHAGNVPLLVGRGIPVTLGTETLARVRAARPLPLYRWAVWGNPEPLDGQPVPAEHPFKLVPTPGHSDDHVAVWDPVSRIAFTGDLWLGVRASVVHANENPITLVASLKRILALEPALVFDAHRGLLRDPAKAFGAKITWLERTIDSILELGRRDYPADRIARDVIGREDTTTVISGGEMSKRNFVRAVLRHRAT
jgi:glyoxylase-like metal-dependent hydrolase (beta-lactamase superfamily II)